MSELPRQNALDGLRRTISGWDHAPWKERSVMLANSTANITEILDAPHRAAWKQLYIEHGLDHVEKQVVLKTIGNRSPEWIGNDFMRELKPLIGKDRAEVAAGKELQQALSTRLKTTKELIDIRHGMVTLLPGKQERAAALQLMEQANRMGADHTLWRGPLRRSAAPGMTQFTNDICTAMKNGNCHAMQATLDVPALTESWQKHSASIWQTTQEALTAPNGHGRTRLLIIGSCVAAAGVLGMWAMDARRQKTPQPQQLPQR